MIINKRGRWAKVAISAKTFTSFFRETDWKPMKNYILRINNGIPFSSKVVDVFYDKDNDIIVFLLEHPSWDLTTEPEAPMLYPQFEHKLGSTDDVKNKEEKERNE